MRRFSPAISISTWPAPASSVTRVVVSSRNPSRATVTIERRVYKEERILVVDKEEDIKTDDHTVEKQILDEIGRSL